MEESGHWRNLMDDQFDDTNAALESFVAQLDASPQKWETHLSNLTESMNHEAQSTLRNEISQMGSKLTMDVGTQLNCSSTIIPELLDKKMSWISKQLLLSKKSGSKKDINFDLPVILCGLDMSSLDLNLAPERRAVIRANGHGFYSENPINVRFYKDRNTYQERKDQKFVYKSSDFNFVFNLSDLEDKFLSQFDHIALTSNEIVVSEIPIIKKKGEKKQKAMVNMTPSDFFPKHTYGDKDFDRTCLAWAKFRLEWSESQVWYNVFMRASEINKGDQTNVQGWSDTTFVYRAPEGFAIQKVEGAEGGKIDYNLVEKFSLGGKGLLPKLYTVPFRLGRLELQGETEGDDVDDGDDSVYAKFRPTKTLEVDLIAVEE